MRLLPHLQPGGAAEPWPDPERALDDPEGLVAAGGDLRMERLLSAYRHGIFPWYQPGQPILWWSPDPRLVFPGCRMHVARSLRRVLRSRRFTYTLDEQFARVIAACAAPRGTGGASWITPEMQTAYQQLHAAGHAHSLEVWQDGRLAGGVYGVAVGCIFFGESMFSRASDASKAGLAVLCAELRRRGFELLDGQLPNDHLQRLGGQLVARAEFLRAVRRLATHPGRAGRWSLNVHDPDAACGVE